MRPHRPHRTLVRAISAALVLATAGVSLPVGVAAVGTEPSTVTVTDSPDPSSLFQAVTLTATISPHVAEGFVTFEVDGGPVGVAPVGADSKATLDHAPFPEGTSSIRAYFGGTDVLAPSWSTPVSHEAIETRTPVEVTISSGQNPSLRNDPVPFTVTIDPVPDGGVLTIYSTDGSNYADVDPSGVTVMQFWPIVAGTHEVHVCYSGWVNHADACSETVDQVVLSFPTSTSLEVEPLALYRDEPLTLRVAVEGPLDQAVNATIRRSNGAFVALVPIDPATGLGEVTLTGQAVHDALTWGPHSLTATYPQTSHTDESASAPVAIDIKRDSTTTTAEVLTPIINPGDTLAVGAVIVPAPPVGTSIAFRIAGPTGLRHGNGTTDATGAAQGTILTPPTWPLASYTVTASWSGTERLAPSEGSDSVVFGDTIVPWFNILSPPELTAGRTITLSLTADGTGTAVTHVALSNDGTTWTTMPYATSVPWMLTAGDGVKLVRARVVDAAGNWSAIAQCFVQLDTTAPSGNVAIEFGAPAVNDRLVDIAVNAIDGHSVTHVALSNDGTTYTTRAYAPAVTWTLAAGGGTGRTVWVKWRDGAGNWSSPVSDTILLDTVAPSAGSLTNAFLGNVALSSGRPTVKLAWTGADATSGIARYELRVQTDGGAWTTVSGSLTGTSLNRALSTGPAYRYSVRAFDKAGNASGWAYGSTFRLTGHQQTSGAITYGGSWLTSSSTAFWGGTARFATAQGARASFTFTGRSVAWLSLRSYNRGKANIYVNGVYAGSVDLYAAATQGQRIVWTRSWSTSASRTIEIRVVGTVGRPRVDVDGFFAGS